MSNFYYFIDPQILISNPQGEESAFGPVLNSESTKYRVTSKFSINQDSMAFAVVKGIVFIQPQYNEDPDLLYSTTLVNLVLKPIGNIDNGFTQVDYFIYRGIRREDIVSSLDEMYPETRIENSDYLKELWADFHANVQEGITTGTVPSIKRTGLGVTISNNDTSLNEVFNNPAFRSSGGNEVNYTTVEAGMSLGKFKGNENIGFEVILKDKLYTPNLYTSWYRENIIEYDSTVTPLQNKRNKEQILNFIDPSSFFSTLFTIGIKNPINYELTQGFQNIYDEYIKAYYTRNTIYLDIRNENGYSLNYYIDNENLLGNNFKLNIGGTSLVEEKYQSNAWPIYTARLDSVTNDDNILIGLAFLKRYNPQPLVYIDYGFKHQPPYNLPQRILNQYFPNLPLGEAKFMDDSGASVDWSHEFKFSIPNIATGSSQFGAFSSTLKIILNKHERPSTPVNSEFPRKTFLDNVFSISPLITSFFTSRSAIWEMSLGKKYFNAIKEIGFEGILELGIVSTSDSIQFIAEIQEYRTIPKEFEANFGFSPAEIIGAGVSDKPRILSLPINKRVDALKVELKNNESILHLIGNKFSIFMTKDEFESDILPLVASFDNNIHEILLGIDLPIQQILERADGREVSAYSFFLSLSGLGRNGNYLSMFINPDKPIISSNRFLYYTNKWGESLNNNEIKVSDPNSIFSIELLIDYVKIVENYFGDLDLDIANNNLYALNTATRIRVHSYGLYRKADGSYFSDGNWLLDPEGMPLENAIMNASYIDEVAFLDEFSTERMLRNRGLKHQLQDSYTIAYRHLAANADENSVSDNPSPYILVKDSGPVANETYLDMGQLFYGFEAIVNNGVGEGYLKFGIDNSYVLAGIIANIATPIAEILYHNLIGEPPKAYKGQSFAPRDKNDLFRYFKISSPEADMYANADAIGLANAFDALNANMNLKLSDILSLYYLEINSKPLIDTSITGYTFKDRWINLAKYLKLITKNGNQYLWLPYSHNTVVWNQPQGTENEGRKEWLFRIIDTFSLFWYNVLINKYSTGLDLVKGHRKEKTLVYMGSYLAKPIQQRKKKFIDNELMLHDNFREMVLENHFFPFLKGKLEQEGVDLI